MTPIEESTATLDTTRIDDTRIASVRPLMTPALMLEEQLPVIPCAPEHTVRVVRARTSASVLRGQG